MAEVASVRESSSSRRILEEIKLLIANNSSMVEALEKLMVELSAQKNQDKLEFQKMKKHEETNAQTLANVQILVKRLLYNVARLANVDIHELKTPIPQDEPTRESKTPQQQFKQPEITQQKPPSQSEASSPQKQKQPMGPPPSMPKLLTGPPTNIPKPDTSKVTMQRAVPVESSSMARTGETEFSKQFNAKEKRRREDEVTSSKRPRTAIGEDLDGKLKEFTMLKGDLHTIMYPEEHLKHYYCNNQEDKLERPPSPVSRNIVQLINEGKWEILHKPVTNPIISIERISAMNIQGSVLGTYGQNKYTLIREDRTKTIVTDGDLDDDIHPLGLVKLKQLIDKDKSSSVVIRRALDNIKNAGEKIY
ncbi:hypothetical protein Hanom_Chr17g01576591 [Helianthus anomalus]